MGIFNKEKKAGSTIIDNEAVLLSKLDLLLTGNFEKIDENEFSNPELGKKLNALIDLFINNNNEFVLDLNASMMDIGDSSCVKDMLEQLDSQTTGITEMRGSSNELGQSIEKIAANAQAIRENTHEAIVSSDSAVSDLTRSSEKVNNSCDKFEQIGLEIESLKSKIDHINSIIDIVKKIAGQSSLLALNASIEAARAGDAGKGFMVVANQMQELAKSTAKSSSDVSEYVEGLKGSLESIFTTIGETTDDLTSGNDMMQKCVSEMKTVNDTLSAISVSIDNVSEEINTQYALTENFISSVDIISDSYNTLKQECLDTGSHLHKISRKVDSVRTHMAKKVSRLSNAEWIDIFLADHLIFTWRQYNHVVGYEKFEIDKINNPDGCKLGKWIAERKKSVSGYTHIVKEADTIHRSLHTHAVETFRAAQNGNKKDALEHFNLIYEDYTKLATKLKALREELA